MKANISKLTKKRLLIILIPLSFIFISIASLNSRLNIKNYYELNTSIINLLDKKVSVIMEDKTIELQPFDIYTERESIKNNSNRKFKVVDENNTTIEEFETAKLSRENHLLLKVISDKIEFCFVGVNVKNIFYSNDLPKISLEDVTQYPNTQKNMLSRLLDNSTIFTFPGYDSLEQLPATVSQNDLVIGIYPIECEVKENTDEVFKIVNLFRNYNAQTQREYYESKITEINNLSL